MLLNETVKVKWHVNNRQWYESKGYKFTKYRDEFNVDIENLPNGSHNLVDVICDCCEKLLKNVEWRVYLKYVKGDDKYYCNKCNKKLYGTKNMIKAKLLNSKSFEQWCIDNDRLDVLNRWDYELNKCKPSDISYGTKKKYYFKCPEGIHESELKNICNFTKGENGAMNCRACNSFAQWGIDNICPDFLGKYWDYDKNNKLGIDPWEILKNYNKKVFIFCQEKEYHESYDVRSCDFIKGHRCPCCSGKGTHIFDSIGILCPEVMSLWSNKNKLSPFSYSPNSNKKVWWKCLDGKHDDYSRKISDSNKYGFRCPECIREKNESFLQQKVGLYLKSVNNGIHTILHEHNCTILLKNPKSRTNNILPFDNEVKELKLLIEVHGEQHYKITGLTKKQSKRNKTDPEYELHMQKVRDRYKRICAKSQGFYYLEIPYWTDDENETYKRIIDEKINEILHSKQLNEVS